MTKTLDAIESSNMIFITAQPDTIYFHWQVELYMYQFAKHGIAHRCYALFGYQGDGPSEYAKQLAKRYNVFSYKDSRDTHASNFYIPSIRPHLLKQFFTQFPELGRTVFYHDSDIFLVTLPKFENLLSDDYAYLSDTMSYINHSYIKVCGKRYKDVYPELTDDDILKKMCACANISEEILQTNDLNSGGAQYLLKGITSKFWEDIETTSNNLFTMLKEYEIRYPIHHHIQSWTADMWAVLWTYWKHGKQTRISQELEFSWATDGFDRYNRLPIFHLAGITDETSANAFYKGNYTFKNVFQEYILDRTIFDNVSKDSATYGYVNVIKEYVNSDAYIYTKSFVLLTDSPIGGLYKEDPKTIYFKKAVWRSITGNYIIFFNGSKWVLIETAKISQISPSLEGIAFATGIYPHLQEWNIPCRILKG